MQIREPSLAEGWYPRTPDEIADYLSAFSKPKGRFFAAIAPHAGWAFSGRLAALAVSSLDHSAQTVAVLGGHLPGNIHPLFALEDAVRTPLGLMAIDKELRGALMEAFAKGSGRAAAPYGEDRFRDNTIEVLLPMVRFFFPEAALLWLRLGADMSSFAAGGAIWQAAKKLSRNVTVLASADLTHWGKKFGFAPLEIGEKALEWVRDVNDCNFIRAVEEGDAQEVLRQAGINKASCSAGAIAGAMGFAGAAGLPKARLLEYATSADVTGEASDSFVGYAAMVFG